LLHDPEYKANLMEQFNDSPLYSPDLAPIPMQERTWTTTHLAALWVGMAVCIPTYLLASYMIKSGMEWYAALIIIGLANVVITVPMVLNGHAGVKYGISFPVFGRSVFGTVGVHFVSVVRALVACGWFGVQTWVGGMAIFSIWNAITGQADVAGLSIGEFVSFGVFWLVNMFFIWKGIESIKWLENLAAPILIIIGVGLVYWGYEVGGSFFNVLEKGKQLGHTTATVTYKPDLDAFDIKLDPLSGSDGICRVDSVLLSLPSKGVYKPGNWQVLNENKTLQVNEISARYDKEVIRGDQPIKIVFSGLKPGAQAELDVYVKKEVNTKSKLWQYLLWFTAMVGFWATMSISISDITRFARSKNDQIYGQFLGLPGTMVFYSFVGIFVTSASVLAFDDILIAEDAPWDPISLVSRFHNPVVIMIAQFAMLVATLSTNIAANVIAPANAFSNLFPKKIGFMQGGFIAGFIGIVICPWWLMDEISGLLIFISGLLGPVLGVLICDYFIIRKTHIDVAELYNPAGAYAFGGSGINMKAILALVMGALAALIGFWVPSLDFLFSLSWFTGFLVAFVCYWLLKAMK